MEVTKATTVSMIGITSLVGDLDECNGRFGPTENIQGIYHYVALHFRGPRQWLQIQWKPWYDWIPIFPSLYHGVADDAQVIAGPRRRWRRWPRWRGWRTTWRQCCTNSVFPHERLIRSKNQRESLGYDLDSLVLIGAACYGT